MERRGFLLLATALLAVWAPAGSALSGDDDSGRGRGRGRGGDDDDNSGSGSDDSGGDDDGDDDDDDGGGGVDGGGDDGGSGTGVTSGGGSGRRPEVDADTVVLRRSDGTAERIRNGRYERLNRNGRVVESRGATGADVARVAAARPGRGGEIIIRIDSSKGEVETVDRRGWRELIAHGTYLLTDPNGNVVKRREARQSDIGRILGMAGA